MNDLNTKAFFGNLRVFIGLSLMLFLPAWTFNYWQAWVFLAVFFTSMFSITLYLIKYDRELLKRRMKVGHRAEKEISQKIIQIFASIAFTSLFVVSSLDHRFGWSDVSGWEIVTGNGLVALGFLIVFFVFRENTYAAGTVQIDAEHKVIATGPYAFMRHPMYAGVLILLFGTPLALASHWGLLLMVPMTLVLGWRILDEEKFLTANLTGYAHYKRQTRYRLVPFIW